MRSKADKSKLIDYIFWLVFILFTNPGGMMEAFGEDSGDGGVNVSDFLFFGLLSCYALVLYKNELSNNKVYKKFALFVLITAFYHFIIFNFFVPVFKDTASAKFSFILIKSRHELYSILLFFMTYRFFLRSYFVFFRLFLFSSILIMLIFLFSAATGVEILPVGTVNRGFVNIDRMLLVDYGLMPLLIPLGAVIISFKIQLSWRNYFLIGFGLMFLTWLLSLTRRHIFGALIYLAMAMILNNYILRKSLIPVGRALSVAFYSFILGIFILVTFPKYLSAGVSVVEETLYVIEHGETTTGRSDARLGLGKTFMQNLIKDNYMWGTGFDNRWRGSGDKLGFETSDYPFLSAIAMKGIMGILFFVPVYFLLIKVIRHDILFFRRHNLDFNSLEFMMFMLFIVFFTYDLLQYMNLFKPISRLKDYEWYMYLAMYLASRNIYFQKLNQSVRIKNNDIDNHD